MQRLFDSQGLDRPNRERKPSRRIQTKWVAEARQNGLRHNSNALVGVRVFHGAIVFDCLSTIKDTFRHLWKEGHCHEDISYSAPLQSSDEGIRLGLGASEQIQKFKLPNCSTGDDNRRWIKSNAAHEQSSSFLGNFRHNYVQHIACYC